jgi:Ohr subfamily peroxiredoxin
MKVLYTTQATSTGGRTGHSKTADGVLDLDLITPKELGGPGNPPGGKGTNPEQLFACGYSACFLGAMKFVAGQEKLKISDATSVTASVGIGPRDDGKGFGIDVELAIKVPDLDRAAAEALVQKAHVVCPYSHAIKSTIPVRMRVVLAGALTRSVRVVLGTTIHEFVSSDSMLPTETRGWSDQVRP